MQNHLADLHDRGESGQHGLEQQDFDWELRPVTAVQRSGWNGPG